jgi:hypothetical protein
MSQKKVKTMMAMVMTVMMMTQMVVTMRAYRTHRQLTLDHPSRKKHRYRMGGTLHFAQSCFEGNVIIGGLENAPRVRLGVVTELDRERPPSRRKGSNRGRYLYTIAFENGQATKDVDRLPLDQDPDVTFVREMPGDG